MTCELLQRGCCCVFIGRSINRCIGSSGLWCSSIYQQLVSNWTVISQHRRSCQANSLQNKVSEVVYSVCDKICRKKINLIQLSENVTTTDINSRENWPSVIKGDW